MMRGCEAAILKALLGLTAIKTLQEDRAKTMAELERMEQEDRERGARGDDDDDDSDDDSVADGACLCARVCVSSCMS